MPGTQENRRFLIEMAVAVLALAAILIAVLTTGVEAGADALVVRGLYGTRVPYSSIASASLVDDLPGGLVRINGISLGIMDLGYFRSASLGKLRLAVLKKESPYLLIEIGTEKIIVGLGSGRNREILAQVEARGTGR